MKDFHGLEMCGHYCSQGVVGAVNGPIALACSAELLEAESDGSGMLRIMCGLRSTRNSRKDGYTSMHAKKRGTSQGYTPKVSISSTAPFMIIPDF